MVSGNTCQNPICCNTRQNSPHIGMYHDNLDDTSDSFSPGAFLCGICGGWKTLILQLSHRRFTLSTTFAPVVCPIFDPYCYFYPTHQHHIEIRKRRTDILRRQCTLKFGISQNVHTFVGYLKQPVLQSIHRLLAAAGTSVCTYVSRIGRCILLYVWEKTVA